MQKTCHTEIKLAKPSQIDAVCDVKRYAAFCFFFYSVVDSVVFSLYVEHAKSSIGRKAESYFTVSYKAEGGHGGEES